ncbi:hypothetical protein [Nocardia sp. NPDC059239]|uniref:hypothetical protein n=1 Tax=unclassified Nocardia TaxID=2637762 RepID=UPI00367D79A5
MPVRDVLADIDALISEQLDAGELIGGYDYGDPGYPKCQWPGCWHSWHGLAITTRMREMRWHGTMPADYRYRDDDSEVICPGGDFTGPPAPAKPYEWPRPAHYPDIGSLLYSAVSLFGDFAASLRTVAASFHELPSILGSWDIPDSSTLHRLVLPPNPLLPAEWPHADDTPTAPDPVLDRAMQEHPPAPSLLDPDTEYADGLVWVDQGSGFESVARQGDRTPAFGLSVTARLDSERWPLEAWGQRIQPPRRIQYPRPIIRGWGSGIPVRWEITIGDPAEPTPPPRRQATLVPTYRCQHPTRIEQPRPWVQERTFDRRGQRPKRGPKR